MSESSIDVVGNKSTVTGTLYYYGNGESWNANTACSITINGSTKNFTANIGKNTNGVIGSYSVVVARNPDGNKTISYSAYADVSDFYGTTRTSGTYKCQWIKRATQPNVASVDVVYGQSITINLPRADSGFTHKLSYSIGNGWVQIGTGITTSKAWTIPKDLAKSATEKPILPLTIRAETFTGSTSIGTRDLVLSVKPSADMIPSVSIGLSDPTGLFATYGGFIKNQSRIKATLTETLSYNSPIKKREVVIDEKLYSTSPCESTEPIRTAKVTATVTDGRGQVASASTTGNLIDWHIPKLTSVKIQRCTASGTLLDDGDYIRVDFAVEVASLGTKKPNSKKLKISYKEQGEENYTQSVNVSLSNYKQQGFWVLNTSGSYGYDVLVELSDDFETSSFEGKAGTAFALINWNTSGKGIAFGKVSEKDEFECAMPAEFSKGVKVGNIDYTMTDAEYQTLLDLLGVGGIARLIDWIYPIGAVIASSNEKFDPNKLYSHQTWERYAKGRTLVGVDENDTDFSTADKTGGEKTHALTTSELPKHRPAFVISNVANTGNDYSSSGATVEVTYGNIVAPIKGWTGTGMYIGNDKPHNNMQPYVAVYYWRRKA